MGFSHLETCAQLGQADLELAISTREDCRALLLRMSEISAPKTGVAAVVSVFAALASAACDWLDGDLVIELLEEDDVTTIRVSTDLGRDMREKVFAPIPFRVALSEILAAIDGTPGLLGALKLHTISWKRVELLANEQVRRSTMPPRIGVSGESAWMLDKLALAQKDDEKS
jgi:hypothetical protein